jgi:hypothetical protein
MWGIVGSKIEIEYMISVIGHYKSLTIKVGDLESRLPHFPYQE